MARNEKSLIRALQGKGYRLTAARRDICATLMETGGHLTPDDLVDAVRLRNPGIGRMTVYRTLDLLCDLGLVRPVHQNSGAAQYVVLDEGHHHHFLCRKCGRFIEFTDCMIDSLAESISARFDLAVEGHLLELYGCCAECRQRD